MRISLRPALYALTAVGVALLSSACISDVTSLSCSAISNNQSSVKGDTVITTTGLKYRELHVGTGAAIESVAECQDAEIQYIGKLTDGTVFDQTEGSETIGVTVGQGGLITGFEQGLVGMRVGGTRQFIIPPSLGYGNQAVTDNNGNVIIPPNSTLIFDVTLVSLD
jgi:FKBP-type peptidyl-prolyl cis-trans isomerase